MTEQPTDDELRAMLEARASRLSPDTEREAMAGLRAAMRGTPDATGGFAVLPVAISSRGARLPGGIAAIGLVAVLVVAVVGGKLATPQEGAASVAPGTNDPKSVLTPAASGPDTAVFPAEALPQGWLGSNLGEALADRSIVGQIVVIDGPITTRLCNPGGSCVVDIDGVEGTPIVFPRPPHAEPDLVGPGGRTALRARADGGLDYLGQLDADPQRPLTVDGLVHEDPTPGRGLFVGGWLLPRLSAQTGPLRVLAVPAPSGATTRDSILSGTRPNPDGSVDIADAVVVALDDDYLQNPRTLTNASTFLVSSAGGGWRVDGIVVATIHQPVISLPVIGGTLTPDELRARLLNGSLEGRLVVIDGILLPNQRACGLNQGECAVPFIDGLRDVQMGADDFTQRAIATDPPYVGPHVFVVHDGTLDYLGPEPSDVDHPMSVANLIGRSPGYGENPLQLQLVSGWLVKTGTTSWLTDDHPTRSGSLSTEQGAGVSVGTLTLDGPVTEGPFLVRSHPSSGCASATVYCALVLPGWDVVARLGPTSPLRSPLP